MGMQTEATAGNLGWSDGGKECWGDRPRDFVKPGPETRRRLRLPQLRCVTFGPLAKSLGIGAITQRQAAYVAALMYGTGAAMVFATVVLPHGGGQDTVVVLSVASIAALTSALFATFGPRMAPCRFYVADLAGSVLISILVAFGGTDATVYAMLYVWAAIYAFYFFGFRFALAAGLWIAVCAAAAEVIHSQTLQQTGSLAAWLMAVGTAGVAGLVIQDLMRRLLATVSLDPLTSAANRASWDTEAVRSVAIARRQRLSLSVLIADLDHFKIYNDDYGHQAGDALLVETVRAWKAVMRDSDVVARYGGEEFGFLLLGSSAQEAMHMAERLRVLVPKGQTVSIGVADLEPGDDVTSLVARADAALYQAKARGRNRVEVASDPGGALDLVAEVSRWAKVVQQVLGGREINMAYQPIRELGGGGLLGVEALARPADASLGVEGMFAIAQRMGRLSELDWTCRRAALRLPSRLGPEASLFINVSVASLLEESAAERMCQLAKAAGVEPARIVLELTERENVTNLAHLTQVLETHRQLGFRVAIDDVGEGHSTLELLAAIIPDYIKLAGGLVRRCAEPGARAAIGAAVAFAELSGVMVIAEGIEDAAVAEALRVCGAHFGQGYHLGRPEIAVSQPVYARELVIAGG
jgi:diguanylate cyclase (GGDEF)-like protein